MTGISSFNGDRVLEILSIPTNSRTEYESLELLELTYSIHFFSKLRERYSDVFHRRCCQVLTLERFSKKQYIYQKDDPSIKYYILLQGDISLLKSKRVPKTRSKSSESSSEEDEDFGIHHQRPRFKAFTVNPEIMYELSKFTEVEENKKESVSILTKDVLEKESQELCDLIMQASGIEDTEKEMKTIKPGGDFGQEAFFPARVRSFHAVAKTKVIVASLHKMMFKKIIHEIAIERGMNMLGFLSKFSIFNRWSKGQLVRVLNLFHLKSFKKGQYLFYQNEATSSAYFISKGNFAISKNSSKPLTQESFSGGHNLKNFSANRKKRLIKMELVIKGEYEILGAEEILTNTPTRVFSCICNSTLAEVYEVSKSDFFKLLKPDTLKELLSTAKANALWLKTRSESLEENQNLLESFELSKTLDKREPESDRRKSINGFFGQVSSVKNSKNGARYSVEKVQPVDVHFVNSTQRIFWNSCGTGNAQVSAVKKNVPKLAPAGFVRNLGSRRTKRAENKSFDFNVVRSFDVDY